MARAISYDVARNAASFGGFGSFRREWVVPELTLENWQARGLLLRNAEGLTYLWVHRVTTKSPGEDDVVRWAVRRAIIRDGSVVEGVGIGAFDSIAAAVAAANQARKEADDRAGPLTEEEIPDDIDSGWFVFTPGPRPG